MTSIDKHIKAVTAWHTATRKGRSREPRPVTLPSQPTQWDMGANGPANRRGLKQEDAMDVDPVTGKTSNPNGVKRMRRVDMLERWHRKGQISAANLIEALVEECSREFGRGYEVGRAVGALEGKA